jgi:hypothetical protein
METFYKIEVPKGEESRHEYHQLKVSAAESNLWRLRQFHGWWDEASQEPKQNEVVLDNALDPVSHDEV